MKTARTLLVLGLTGVVLTLAGSAMARKATTFELKDMNGRKYALEDEIGDKVIIMNFWATWCAPCRVEMKALDEMHDKYADKGLRILAVSVDDPKSTDQVKPLVRRNGYDFKVLLDPESRVVTMYNPRKTVPFTVVIDRKGRVVHERLGYEPGAEKELEKKIKKLLDKKDEKAKKSESSQDA